VHLFIIYFVGYLTALQVSMNEELEKIWKEAVLVESKYNPGVWLEGLRKPQNILSKMLVIS
jgi:hypothetical protein